MSDIIIKLGLKSNMLNYVDNETPRRYFLSGNADEDDLQKFAELIIKECACLVLNGKYDGEKFNPTDEFHQGWNKALDAVAMGIKQYFGVEE